MKDSTASSFLKDHFSAWDHLDKQEQETLLSNTTSVHYAKGASIHCGHDDCIGLLLIQSGMLRTYMLSEEGKEVTLYRCGPGPVSYTHLGGWRYTAVPPQNIQTEESPSQRGIYNRPFSAAPTYLQYQAVNYPMCGALQAACLHKTAQSQTAAPPLGLKWHAALRA